MKKADLIFIFIALVLILPYLPFSFLSLFQKEFLFNEQYWWITSFLKFATLATLGESIGLKIMKGVYNYKGFGLLPRAIVWGFLGIGIKVAFVVFAVGAPVLMEKYFGVQGAIASMDKIEVPSILDALDKNMGLSRFISAFSISVLMNLIFAPVFMTLHKITDTHILNNGGSLKGFLKPIQFGKIFPSLNWFILWDFVFKKTIPFFWIPAHTITFLLPEEYRVLFAAALGIVLGVFLAVASMKK